MKQLFLMLALVATSAQAEWSSPKCRVDPIDDSNVCVTSVVSDSGEELSYFCSRKSGDDSISSNIIVAAAEKSVMDIGKYDARLRVYRHTVRMRGDKSDSFTINMVPSKNRSFVHEILPPGIKTSIWKLHVLTTKNLAIEIPYYGGKKVVYFDLAGENIFKTGTVRMTSATDELCKQ